MRAGKTDLHAMLQPGPHSHAVRYVTYCGPAKAIVRVNGSTFGLHPGHCVFEGDIFDGVRIGVLAVHDAAALPVIMIGFLPAPVSAGTFKLAETATGSISD